MQQNRRSVGKRVAFSLLGLTLLLAATELLARVVSFQLRGEHRFALAEALDGGWAPNPRSVAAEAYDAAAPLYQLAREHLTTEVGKELLAELEAEYASHFRRFVDDVRAARSELFVLNFLSEPDSPHGAFVASLVAKHGVDYLDVSEQFGALRREHTMLLPYDFHLTRYGNLFVAQEVARYLDEYAGCTSGRQYPGTPRILGDLPASIGDPRGRIRRQVCAWKPEFGFTVDVNTQGFRNAIDLATTKTGQRVLCIGDSYTFGPHVDTVDTFPALVEWLRPEAEMVNAGICGYTISDQASLFAECAVRAAPDVTILQVCDNDVIELTAWSQNFFGRVARGSHEPSEVEKSYFQQMRQLLATRNGSTDRKAEEKR